MATPQGQRRLPRHPMYVSLPSLKTIPPIDRSFFVDRMPTVIGRFISRNVYGSKLQTVHTIHIQTCCRFVDVSNGKETKKGGSWTVRPTPPRNAHLSVVADAYLTV